MIHKPLMIALLAFGLLLMPPPARAHDYDGYDQGDSSRPCQGLSGQEKKACIREVKRAHAERYRERRMERRGEREGHEIKMER